MRRMVGALALLLVSLGAAGAADFPSQPIRLIVPWPPGGSSDVSLRVLADAASKQLGQPIIIENKPGAAGTLGPGTMASTAKPDGYTVSQMPVTVFRQPFIQKTSYDPAKDFTYIIGLTGYTFGVVVRADAPWRSFDELVAHAKANPGKVSYGSPGIGTTLHITMERIAEARGLQWLHVPFKGNDSSQALLAGEIDVVADSTGWAPFVEAGKFRLLVTWGAERTKRFPNVPTLAELGYGIVTTSPYGIAGPKGIDPKIVQVLHDGFKRALDDPAYRAILERFDQPVVYLDTAAYREEAMNAIREQKEIVEKLGLKAE